MTQQASRQPHAHPEPCLSGTSEPFTSAPDLQLKKAQNIFWGESGRRACSPGEASWAEGPAFTRLPAAVRGGGCNGHRAGSSDRRLPIRVDSGDLIANAECAVSLP
ncbi:hypothetical protein GCM10025871_38380 [Deinococcus metallilatus]|nr:hypothetical protein GCM10025871_38380 [Deinococcus metallilatus]